nr:MAG TPA: hypothetical protein [Caudoviricetes sp.]
MVKTEKTREYQKNPINKPFFERNERLHFEKRLFFWILFESSFW